MHIANSNESPGIWVAWHYDKNQATTYVYMKWQILILSVCVNIFIGFGANNTTFVAY
jgi:hypothetical protein